MDTLQIKLMIINTISDLNHFQDNEEVMGLADNIYEWIMKEAKVGADEPIQLELLENDKLN